MDQRELERRFEYLSEGFSDVVDGLLGRGPSSTSAVLNSPRYAAMASDSRVAAMAFSRASLPHDVGRFCELRNDWLSVVADSELLAIYPETAAANKYFIGDSTQVSLRNQQIAWVTCKDKGIEDYLNAQLRRVGLARERMSRLASFVVTYGNAFGENVIHDKAGIIEVPFLMPHDMRRVENPNGACVAFMQDFAGTLPTDMPRLWQLIKEGDYDRDTVAAFPSYQVIHWRLRNDAAADAYGRGPNFHTRWVVKRLNMLEDVELAHLIENSAQRFKYDIEMFNADVSDYGAKVQTFIDKHAKSRSVNYQGQERRRFAPNPAEDWYFAMKDGQPTVVISTIDAKTIDYDSARENLKAKLDLMIDAPLEQMKMPQSRSVISQDFPRAAKVSMQCQGAYKTGHKTFCRTSLAAQGFRQAGTIEFEVNMVPPSSIYELTIIEALNAKADLSSRLQEIFPVSWIMQEHWGLSASETKALMELRRKEKLAQIKLEKAQYEAMGYSESDIRKRFAESDTGLVIPFDELLVEPGIDSIDQPIYRTSEVDRGTMPTRASRLRLLDKQKRLYASAVRRAERNSAQVLDRLSAIEAQNSELGQRIQKVGKFIKSVQKEYLSRPEAEGSQPQGGIRRMGRFPSTRS